MPYDIGAWLADDDSTIVAESSTAAVMKLVTKPARMPPAISGTTIRRTVRAFEAPRFSAASSSETCSCGSAAMQERSAYGRRRTA